MSEFELDEHQVQKSLKKYLKMTMLFEPWDVFVSNGEVFLCETFTDRVRKLLLNGETVSITGGENETLGDCQLATRSRLYGPIKPFPHSYHDMIICTTIN